MNMIQSAKDQIAALTRSAYRAAVQEGLLPDGVETVPAVEIPKDTANGDYTTTFCLAAAKALRKNPREVAQILLDNMDLEGSYFTSAAMAGAAGALPDFPRGRSGFLLPPQTAFRTDVRPAGGGPIPQAEPPRTRMGADRLFRPLLCRERGLRVSVGKAPATPDS